MKASPEQPGRHRDRNKVYRRPGLAWFILAWIGLILPAARAADWPHWRGPHRDGTTPESSGWNTGRWPPTEHWRVHVGLGSTSPLVANGKLYTMGWKDGQDHVLCLDASTGKEVWRVSYRAPRFGRHAVGDKNFYGGPTATPEFDPETALLYTLGTDGDLNCWDTAHQGKKLWGFNLYQRFHMPQRPLVHKSKLRDYGYTAAPMVYRDVLLVEVGGNAGTVMAFDKRTGTERWRSRASDLAGHTGGFSPLRVEDVPCVAILTFSGLLVLRLDPGHEGQLVARFPYQTDFANSIASPAPMGNDILITSGYDHKSMTCLRVSLSGIRVRWERRNVLSKVCTPVFLDGKAYWSFMKIHCLDVASGHLLWQGRSGGTAGSCIVTGDQRILAWVNRGDLLLIENATRSPTKCTILSGVKNLFHTEVWPHVALADGRIYCKDRRGNLACLAWP